MIKRKKAGTKNRSRLALAGCPDKLVDVPNPKSSTRAARNFNYASYALLRGRTVKSRTCVRMLDICIPFSCETKGRSSAIN